MSPLKLNWGLSGQVPDQRRLVSKVLTLKHRSRVYSVREATDLLAVYGCNHGVPTPFVIQIFIFVWGGRHGPRAWIPRVSEYCLGQHRQER